MIDMKVESRIEMHVGHFDDHVFDLTQVISITIDNNGMMVEECGTRNPYMFDWDDLAMMIADHIKKHDLKRKLNGAHE